VLSALLYEIGTDDLLTQLLRSRVTCSLARCRVACFAQRTLHLPDQSNPCLFDLLVTRTLRLLGLAYAEPPVLGYESGQARYRQAQKVCCSAVVL